MVDGTVPAEDLKGRGDAGDYSTSVPIFGRH